jgi:hypothetical protein
MSLGCSANTATVGRRSGWIATKWPDGGCVTKQGGAMPDLVGWSPRSLPVHTWCMAKHTHKQSRPGRQSASPKERSVASHGKARTAADLRAFADDLRPPSPQQRLPGIADVDPLHGVDPLEQLQMALDAVGIDPDKAAQPDEFLRDAWHQFATARTKQSEMVALAVAHAMDARAQRASKRRTMHEVQAEADALRELVRATMYLRRGMIPPDGAQDDRRPLRMDGEIIGLVGPQEDARSALVTLKLPQVVIDRLRDAVAALAPTRTMAGIAALGITMLLDVLEAEHLKHTGKRFPKRPGQVLEGGRPSRTRATTAQKAPGGQKSPKKPRLRR